MEKRHGTTQGISSEYNTFEVNSGNYNISLIRDDSLRNRAFLDLAKDNKGSGVS